MAGSREQVITVSMTLDTKSFQENLGVSAQKAQQMAQTIANSLTINSSPAIKGLNDIGIAKDKLMANFVKLKGVISDSITITPAQTKATIGRIGEIFSALDSLQSKARSIGTEINRISTTVGSATKGTKTTATTNAADYPPPTISKANREYTGPFMTPEIRAANQKEYDKMLDDRAKSQFAADKKLVTSSTQMSASMVTNIKKQLSEIPKTVEDVGKKSQGAFAKYFSASFFGNFLANSLFKSLGQLKDLGEETILYAARTQELGIVLGSLAKVHNINTQEITNQEEAIKRLNITTQDARETLAKFINVGFDTKAAGPLARVAQDLAVIGNKNTSEELNQLIVAIQTLQSRNLRNAGVFLTVDEVLDKLSATTGRARDSFSTLEKQQAVLNAVMEYGGRVAGTYQAAMGTTAKQLRSLDRQFKEAQNAIGEDFVNSLGLAVSASSTLLQWVARYPDVFTDAAYSIGLVTVALLALNTQIIQGAYAGVSATFGALTGKGEAARNRQILEAAVTEEKAAQLSLEEAQITATQGTIKILLQKIESEGVLNAELAEQVGLRSTLRAEQEAELVSLQRRNSFALARNAAEQQNAVTAGRATSVAGVVGEVAGVLAVVAIIATVGKLVYDLVTGPYAVGSLDINAIALEAEKTKDLEKISTDLTAERIDLRKADEEIGKRITDQRLVDYRIAQAQTTELEKQQKLQEVISAQIEANNVRRAANITAAGQNIFEAASNFTTAQNTATAQAGAVNGTNKTLGIATRNIGTFVRGGLARLTGSSIESTNKGIEAGLSSTFQEDTKEEAKAQAVLNDALTQGQKIAEAYHTSLQAIIDRRLDKETNKTSEAYIQLTNNIQAAVKAMREQEDLALKLQALTPEEKTGELIKQFREKRTASIESLRAEVNRNIDKFISTPGRTEDEVNKYGQGQLQFLQRGISLLDQNFGTDKANLSGLAGNIGQKLSDIEQQKGPLTLAEKIKAINEQVEIARQNDPTYIKDLFDVGQGFQANTKFVESYLGAHTKLNDELRNSTAELQGFVSQSAADRKLGFQIEANKKILSTVQDISKLEFELGKTPTDLRKFANDIDGAKAYEKSLQRQLKFHDDIIAAMDAQQAAEDEIAELKIKVTIPAVNAELLAQKEILETIQKRKEEEQQLTADIAAEIDKRTRYSLTSVRETNRLSAEVFLEAQKTERQTQEDAIKNVLGLALQSGNDRAFTDNPLIKEAVKQSENLANLEKQGGVQGQKLTTINDTALETNKKLEAINSTLGTKLQELIDKPTGGFTGTADTLSSGYGTSSVGGNIRQRFNVAYNRFASAGVNPNEAKFYAAISAAEGGGDVMYGGRPYNPRDPRHPGMYLPGKMGPAGISYAAGPLQITRENWLKYGGGDFSNMANHVRMAEILSGRGAVQAARSGDFVRAFRLGGGNAWAAIPGSPLPGNKQSISLIASLLGTNLASPTQNVVSKIQATPALIRGKGSWDAVAREYGLTVEEVGQILANAPKTTKGLVEIGETAFAAAGLFKKFGGNAFATGVEATAIGDFAKDFKGRTEAVNISAAMRNVRTFKQASIAALNSAEEWEKYKTEINGENNFGASNRATADAIARRRLTSLRTPGSTFYNQAYGEASSKRLDEQISLEKELITLEEQGDYRRNQRQDYRRNQAKEFYKEQLTQTYSLEDASVQISERENAYLNENSRLRKNILGQELVSREQEKQALTEEIDALKRYNDEYLNSAENRQRIEREAERDRLKEHQDTINQIIRSEEDLTNAREGMEDRLRLKQHQYSLSRAKEYEDNLGRQLDGENQYNRLQEKFDPVRFRADALDKINSSMKDSTTQMGELFSDSFDAISGGFGGLIDKMTAKLGVFGGALGNFLKTTVNNILGRLGKGLLDNIFPQAKEVSDALGNSGTSGTSAVGKKFEDVLGVGGKDIPTTFGMAANAATNFAYVVGQASAVILQSVGQAGSAVLNAGSIVSSGASLIGKGFTDRGTSFSGGIGNRISALSGVVSGGTGGILASLNALPAGGVGAAYPTSRIGGEYGPLLASIGGLPAGGVGAAYPTSGIGRAVSGGIGGLLNALNLKQAGAGLLASLPSLGAGLGGALGGSSVIGQGLGTAGGGLLGVLGGAVGLSVLGGTGITGGAIGSIAGLLGISGAATLGIGAAIGGAFLLGSYLFGRAKRRKEEKKKVTEISGDALKQLQDLLKSVKTDKIDGDEALTRSQEIRDEYVRQIGALKTKPGKRDAQVQLQALDAVIAQIKIAAANQRVRKELDAKIVPTYASGGVTNTSLIRVSQGESLFVPNSAGSYSSADLASAGIPNFRGGGMYTGAKIRGHFDGRDNIVANVPKGTIVANPRQASRIRQAPRFASGGSVSSNYGSFTAQGTVVVQPPPITAIIVMSEEEAAALGRQIPNSIIVNKVRQHINDTGTTGLAGDVLNTLR